MKFPLKTENETKNRKPSFPLLPKLKIIEQFYEFYYIIYSLLRKVSKTTIGIQLPLMQTKTVHQLYIYPNLLMELFISKDKNGIYRRGEYNTATTS